ncbi:MAG: PHB depolymerase family esterase [Planctomycetota bacterium]
MKPRPIPARSIYTGLLAAAFALPAAAQPTIDDFLDWSLYRPSGAVQQPARLYVPRDDQDNPIADRPLVVFLHGVGGGSSTGDNVNQLNENIGNLIAAAEQHQFSLLAPQSFGGFWGSQDVTGNVETMIDNALAEADFAIDPDRVYITGLSAGGGGTWNLASRAAERFAAVAPIAGIRPSSDFDPALLADKPTWAFHARDDMTVGEGNTRRVINDILAAQNEAPPSYPREDDPDFFFQDADGSLRYTEFKSGGHSIWPGVYGDDAFYDWLLDQSLDELTVTAPADDTVVFNLGAADTAETLDDVLTLANTGQAGSTIDILGFTLTGDDPDRFEVPGFAPATVTAGDPAADSAGFDVAFRGGPVGTYRAILALQTDAGDVAFDLLATVVPEPAAATLLALAGLALAPRRRSNSS